MVADTDGDVIDRMCVGRGSGETSLGGPVPRSGTSDFFIETGPLGGQGGGADSPPTIASTKNPGADPSLGYSDRS